MRTVVAYLWGSERMDVMVASAQLTEDVQSTLNEFACQNIDQPPKYALDPLKEFNAENKGLGQACAATGKGYELLAKWMEALYEYSLYTNQLTK